MSSDTQRLSLPPMPSGKAIQNAVAALARSFAGLCADCGKNPKREDSVYCDPCWRGEEN